MKIPKYKTSLNYILYFHSNSVKILLLKNKSHGQFLYIMRCIVENVLYMLLLVVVFFACLFFTSAMDDLFEYKLY